MASSTPQFKGKNAPPSRGGCRFTISEEGYGDIMRSLRYEGYITEEDEKDQFSNKLYKTEKVDNRDEINRMKDEMEKLKEEAKDLLSKIKKEKENEAETKRKMDEDKAKAEEVKKKRKKIRKLKQDLETINDKLKLYSQALQEGLDWSRSTSKEKHSNIRRSIQTFPESIRAVLTIKGYSPQAETTFLTAVDEVLLPDKDKIKVVDKDKIALADKDNISLAEMLEEFKDDKIELEKEKDRLKKEIEKLEKEEGMQLTLRVPASAATESSLEDQLRAAEDKFKKDRMTEGDLLENQRKLDDLRRRMLDLGEKLNHTQNETETDKLIGSVKFEKGTRAGEPGSLKFTFQANPDLEDVHKVVNHLPKDSDIIIFGFKNDPNNAAKIILECVQKGIAPKFDEETAKHYTQDPEKSNLIQVCEKMFDLSNKRAGASSSSRQMNFDKAMSSLTLKPASMGLRGP